MSPSRPGQEEKGVSVSLESWLDDATQLLPESSIEAIAIQVSGTQPLNRGHAKELIIDWIDWIDGDNSSRKRTIALHLKLAWRKRIKKLESELAGAREILQGL
jgi:hypothetical protein